MLKSIFLPLKCILEKAYAASESTPSEITVTSPANKTVFASIRSTGIAFMTYAYCTVTKRDGKKCGGHFMTSMSDLKEDTYSQTSGKRTSIMISTRRISPRSCDFLFFIVHRPVRMNICV